MKFDQSQPGLVPASLKRGGMRGWFVWLYFGLETHAASQLSGPAQFHYDAFL